MILTNSMNLKNYLFFLGACLNYTFTLAQSEAKRVPDEMMQRVYEEVKTPYKYGLAIVSPDPTKKTDCPSVFRKDDKWYMTYLIFDGRGYETWLAQSDDLLHWETQGRLMSFSDSSTWDAEQKAGYIALQDTQWGGSYAWQPYQNKHWMTYLGGNTQGYERGLLSIGLAWTEQNSATAHEWERLSRPILMATDEEARWFENSTLYKSSVIWDQSETIGYPFVMYYNARGDSLRPERGAEWIGMAVSEDMVHWKRFGENPVINHHTGISGDAYLQKMGDLWVMFYFGAFWKDGAFDRFACSYDLVHWTDWEGADLIAPSEPYDEVFAHKPYVIKHKGVVYHFYCAVDENDNRGIAVATSQDMGQSSLSFSSEKARKP